MVKFDIELVQVMRVALEDVMANVPAEYSTPAAKAFLAEYILKAAANGETGYSAFVATAVSYIPEVIRLVFN
jgi:hypothetical protein